MEPQGDSQDGSSGSQRSSNDHTASDPGGGSSGSGSRQSQPVSNSGSGWGSRAGSYPYQPAANTGSGSGSGSGSYQYQPASNSGSGSGSYQYQPASHSGSGSAENSGSGSAEKSGSGSGAGSGSGGSYQYQHISHSGSDQPVEVSDGSYRQGGSSSDPHSSSEAKQSSSSRTGSSSVTWHEGVSDTSSRPKVSDLDDLRRSSSDFDEDISKVADRSSLRRFNEGSKIFAGFIEDADGLQPSDDMLPPMTWEEKCEIIEELCLALEKRLERLKNEKDGILDGLKNYLDVAEHKCNMARKDRVEMHRNVIQFAELLNPSKKSYTEDMLRYLNMKNLDKRIHKEKLETRNKRLEKMVATAAAQLESKLDVRELLHDSDFMEMRNVNEDLANQLNYRARLLVKSRNVSRKIAKATKELREKLQQDTEAKASTRQSLSDRSPLVGKLQGLIVHEIKERDRLHLELLGFVKGEDLRPTALEYMKIRQRSKDIRRELYNWLAKVEIAELKHNHLLKNVAMLESVCNA